MLSLEDIGEHWGKLREVDSPELGLGQGPEYKRENEGVTFDKGGD